MGTRELSSGEDGAKLFQLLQASIQRLLGPVRFRSRSWKRKVVVVVVIFVFAVVVVVLFPPEGCGAWRVPFPL